MVETGGGDKIINLSLLRLARSGLYFGIQIFIPLELLSRATFEGPALQKLQLLGVLHPVLGARSWHGIEARNRGQFN